MESSDIERLIYLTVLLMAVAGFLVAEYRRNLGRTARAALAWALIFVGVVAAYGLWDDVRRDVLPRQAVIAETGAIEVPRGPDGHFHLRLDVNGRGTDFLVDTGATDIVLSQDDARRAGLDPANLRYAGAAETANGMVRTAHVRVETLALGPITLRDVPVSVNAGEMSGSLLGMQFLSRFSRIEITAERMLLEP